MAPVNQKKPKKSFVFTKKKKKKGEKQKGCSVFVLQLVAIEDVHTEQESGTPKPLPPELHSVCQPQPPQL